MSEKLRGYDETQIKIAISLIIRHGQQKIATNEEFRNDLKLKLSKLGYMNEEYVKDICKLTSKLSQKTISSLLEFINSFPKNKDIQNKSNT